MTAADSDWFGRLTLADARRRVVLPVVHSLITPDELDELSLWWRPTPPNLADPSTGSHELWIQLTARDESFSSNIWSTGPAEISSTVSDVAHELALRLEDWVCETRFGWGQQRIAKYQLPD